MTKKSQSAKPGTHDADCETFLGTHPAWVRARLRDDGVLYCLPPKALRESFALFRLEEDDIEAEADLVALCDRHHAIGWCSRGPLQYRLLDKPLPLPQIDDLERLLKFGWSQEHIDFVRKGGVPREDVFHRLQAAAGRLVSSKKFLDDRDAVRDQWTALPVNDRPPLPLWPPVDLRMHPADVPRLEPAAEVAAFWDALAQLCVRWQLTGMTTWDLPEPDGPKWSAMFTPADLADKGGVQLQTPWHFPLQQADDLGEVIQEDHARRAAEHEVDDHASWETYASLLPLAHWQMVVSGRYPKEMQAKAFKTQLDLLLAALLATSPERAKKLRVLLHALRSGRRSSLRGVR